MKNIYKEVLDQIVFQYRGYSTEYRKSTQPFILENVKKKVKNYEYYYNDTLVRETLIEHTGSLPIVATAVYPYIDNKNVDLGKTLTMLAIHDIGELIVGDEMAFTKQDNDNEEAAALKLLPKQYHRMYLDMEKRMTDTGKFAKAIDQMTPDIIDMLTPPEITIQRYKLFTDKEPHEIIPMITAFKRPFMEWNPFLTNLHKEIIGRTEERLKPFYKN